MIATTKAANATEKCASTSFLARNTIQPLSAIRPCHELSGRDHLHAGPHRFVTRTAIFVAWHEVLAGLFERRRKRRNKTGYQHYIRIGRTDNESMHGVGARATKRNGHLCGHDDTLRLERVLLRNQPCY